jgi:hypothetical protein
MTQQQALAAAGRRQASLARGTRGAGARAPGERPERAGRIQAGAGAGAGAARAEPSSGRTRAGASAGAGAHERVALAAGWSAQASAVQGGHERPAEREQERLWLGHGN